MNYDNEYFKSECDKRDEYASVVITPDGIFHRLDCEPDEEPTVEKVTTLPQLFRALRKEAFFSDQLTLRSFMAAVSPFKDFFGDYSWCWDIDSFTLESEQKNTSENKNNLKSIVLKPVYEISSLGVDNDNYDITFRIDVSGEGEGEDGNTEYYAIEFTPLNELAELPIRADKINVLHRVNERLPTAAEMPEAIEREKNSPMRDLFDEPRGPSCYDYDDETKIAHSYSLLELIDAILFEISFFGSPESRDENLASLNIRCEEAKNIDRSNC